MGKQTIYDIKSRRSTKKNLIAILEKQGFIYSGNKLALPKYKTPKTAKQGIRNLNKTAIKHLIEKKQNVYTEIR